MATILTNAENQLDIGDEISRVAGIGGPVLSALGSLKLTVALFAFSLILVLVGTLAQDEMNMLDVKQRYFLSWIAMLHFDDFFPQAFYRHDNRLPGHHPFPGGALIGMMLMVNLLAAKITRFKIHTSGTTLMTGIGFLIAGTVGRGPDRFQRTQQRWTARHSTHCVPNALGRHPGRAGARQFRFVVNGRRMTGGMRTICFVACGTTGRVRSIFAL